MKYVMRDVGKIFRRNRYELIDKQSKQETGYYIVAMTYWLYLLCEQQLFRPLCSNCSAVVKSVVVDWSYRTEL